MAATTANNALFYGLTPAPASDPFFMPTPSHARFVYPSPPQKRKLRLVADSDDDDGGQGTFGTASASAPPLRKRRKSPELETGFAHLSLLPPVPPAPAPSPVPAPAYIIEEPPESAPQVKMRSWYEPEKDRIVVTDLNDYDEEEGREGDEGLSISSAVLDKFIKSVPVPIPTAPPCQELVLYQRPLSALYTVENEECEKRRMPEPEGMDESIKVDLITVTDDDDDRMDVD